MVDGHDLVIGRQHARGHRARQRLRHHPPGHRPPPSGASSCGTGLSADSLTSNISDQYGPGSAAPPAGAARPSPRHSVGRRASAGGQLPGA